MTSQNFRNRIIRFSLSLTLVASSAYGKTPTPINVDISVGQRWQGITFFIDGKTNLPNDTKLKIWFEGKNEGWSDDCEITVERGHFRTKGFIAFENPVPLDTYIVSVQMLPPAKQTANFRTAVGDHGERLTGKLVTQLANNDRDVTLETELTVTQASRKAAQEAPQSQSDEEIKAWLEDMIKMVLGDQLDAVQVSGPKNALNVRIDFNEKGSWSKEDNECMKIACFVERKMRDCYQTIFTSAVAVNSANIVAYMPGQLAGPVYATVMDRKTASRIDWEKKASIDFRKIWRTNIKDKRLE